MSKIRVDLQPRPENAAPVGTNGSRTTAQPTFIPQPVAAKPKKKRGIFLKILLTLFVLLLVGVVAIAGVGYWWYTSLLKSPTYSIALLVDSARKDDQKQVEQFVDTNAVVDDFVPQVTAKAKERYGRGFPPQVVQRAEAMLQPLLPTIKDRARKEIPRLIKDKAQVAPEVSPVFLAFGLNRVFTTEEAGNNATVKTEFQGRAVEFKMQKSGADRWKIVGVKDEVLADKIANEVAQKILQMVNDSQTKGKKPNTADLVKEIENQIKIAVQ
jgi:hypothetical protein